MKKTFYLLVFTFCLFTFAFAQTNYIKIQMPDENDKNVHRFKMGTAINPAGETVEIDAVSMLWNGRRVIPVMGEIHFSRVAASEWRSELQKMRDGGINIIATYVFWMHHEEIEGQFDWTGQRNLRDFITLCKEMNFKLVLRIGPWCHGEVRNGGFPNWLATSGMRLRQNDADYLAKVEKWYNAVFAQAKGFLWKDGGTVVGIQIENEYRGRWEHLAKLKEIAVAAGFDVPFYTRTGWPALTSPAAFGELLPLYGDYSDGFWDRSLKEMPGDYPKAYLFRSFRSSTVIATEIFGQQSETDTRETVDYPYFTCELGGGMMPSYHRRINIAPMDIYAMALVKVGSGSNLPGYYMYHGGTNPDGKLTYLNEIQASPMTNHNDLPVKTYDFQAPIGEFGQINAHYWMLKNIHTFLHTFGEKLSEMPAFFPDGNDNLRWAVRTDGKSGYVFVNNYERLKYLPEKPNVQFTIDLPHTKIVFPETPFTVPAGVSFFFPFNMDLGGIKLQYATAQPVSKEKNGNLTTYSFLKIKGINAEFMFDNKKIVLDEKNREFVQNNVRIALLEPRKESNPKLTKVKFSKIQDYGTLRTIPIGEKNVAASPTDEDFEQAAVWKINIPKSIDYFKNDVFLKIDYTGDVARIYADDYLLTDNFYNGKIFEINLRYFKDKIKDNTLILKILPLQKDAPIYLPVNVDFKGKEAIVEVKSIEISVKKP